MRDLIITVTYKEKSADLKTTLIDMHFELFPTYREIINAVLFKYPDAKNIALMSIMESTKEYLSGVLVDKRYMGEKSSSGVGTAIVPNANGGVGVGVVSTSSHTDEEFLFFVKADKIYKIEVDMQQFYSKNIGEPVRFELIIGGLSKDQIDVQLTQ